jgi:hypothetical protein
LSEYHTWEIIQRVEQREENMIITEIYVKKIDYDSLLRFMVPMLESGLANQSNPLLRMAAKVIGKDGEPTGFASFFVNAMPKKEEIVAQLLPRFDEVMIRSLNAGMAEQGIHAEVSRIESKAISDGREATLKFGVVIDHIDYESIIDALLPGMLQKLSEKESKLGRVLLGMNQLPASMLKAAIGVIPVNERDSLLVSILKEYKEDFINLLDTMLQEKKIKAEISRVEFEGITET